MIIGAAAIFINTYYHSTGYTTSDSMMYLRQAAFLVKGQGFVAAYRPDFSPGYFAVWPLGYPIAIFIVSTMLGISVFWAAKVLNILLLATSLLLIAILFPKNSWVFQLTLLSGSLITVFSYTWSEGFFITASLLFVYALYSFMTQGYKMRYAAILLLAMCLMFSARYIGLFVLIPVGYYCIKLGMERQYKAVTILFFVCLNFILLAGLYLVNNQQQTGFTTGTPRPSATSGVAELVMQLLSALIVEFDYIYIFFPTDWVDSILFCLTIALPALILVHRFWRIGYLVSSQLSVELDAVQRPQEMVDATDVRFTNLLNSKSIVRSKNSEISTYCITIGLFYYLALALLRFSSEFDNFNFRLLAPGTILLFLGILFKIQQIRAIYFARLKVIIVILTLLSVTYNIIYANAQRFIYHEYSWPQQMRLTEEKYSIVEAGSLVLCANMHLQYLRPDLAVLSNKYCIDTPQDRIKQLSVDYKGHVYFDDGEDLELQK